jgi:DNA-binding transcriptional LysR family regulator
MTLRQLSYLLAVAEHGSFTAAAGALHVAQPSLSQQIRTLEAELGGPLLERPPGPVRLTAAGRALAAEARPMLAAAHRGEEAVRRAMGQAITELGLATVPSLAVSQLPAAIGGWSREHPGVAVHLHEYEHRRQVEASVRDGESQVGIAPRPEGWDGAVRRLGWEELVAVLPRGDALDASPRLRLETAANRDYVLFEPSHGLRDIVAWACRLAGFEPRGVAYTSQIEAASRLAAAGVGIALVPAAAVPADLAGAAKPLDPPVLWEVSAYTLAREWESPAAELLDALSGANWRRSLPPGARELSPDAAARRDGETR